MTSPCTGPGRTHYACDCVLERLARLEKVLKDIYEYPCGYCPCQDWAEDALEAEKEKRP